MQVTAVNLWAGTQLGLLLVAMQTRGGGLSEVGTLDGNEPGHLSEDCNTAISLSHMLCNG